MEIFRAQRRFKRKKKILVPFKFEQQLVHI